jgi:beta-phosphoglucomutase-like phosphatase (HAD superfamily)
MLVKACRRLGVEPAEVVVVEDSPAGIAAGKAAGVSRIVGLTTTQTAEVLLQAGATEIVNDFTNLTAHTLLHGDES